MSRVRIFIITLLSVFVPTIAMGQQRGQAAQHDAEELGMLLKVDLSAKEAYCDEAVVCTVKLYNPGYSISSVESLGNADYGNCDMRVIVNPQDAYYAGRETIDGQQYNVAILSQFVLFPSSSGTVKIKCPDFRFNVLTKSDYDPFFGFFQQRHSESVFARGVEKSLKVKKLPSKGKPADFTGGIGNFTIKLTIPPGKLTRGSDCICLFTVKGNGSLEEAVFPKLNDLFPEELEVKSVSSDIQMYMSREELVTEGTYEVTFRPAKTGRFTIPEVGFSYFNPTTGKYETTYSEPKEIEVYSLSSSPSSGPVLVSL